MSKCYLSLREDFTINNMFRKIKNESKKCYECQTAEECEEVYENNHNELQLLPIKFTADNDVKHILKNLPQQQDLDEATREFKLRDHLPDHYKVQNGVLYKLMRQDWKVVLTNDMLHKLIRPTHESLAHAAALKCYWGVCATLGAIYTTV